MMRVPGKKDEVKEKPSNVSVPRLPPVKKPPAKKPPIKK